MDILLQTLEGMTYQGGKGTLTDLMRILKIKPGGTRKAKAVEILHQFYTNQNSVIELHKKLSAYEKALLTCIVQSKYNPLEEDICEIAKSYGYKKNPRDYSYYSYGYKEKYFPVNSLLYAFFVKGEVPQIFRDYLDKITPPYIRSFHSAGEVNIDDYAIIIDRESRYRDFDMLLSFINNNNIAATRAGSNMTKTSLLKFQKIACYDDICNNDSGQIQDIRTADETIVSFGMVQLLRCAHVIDIVQGKFVLSATSPLFVSYSMPDKAKFLFEAYLRHGNHIIDEFTRIFSAKLKLSRSVYDLSKPRQEVISYLRECPVNVWIDFGKFSKELYKANNRLFAVTGGAMIRDDYYNQYYESASWDECEHCAISVMLMEYLAVLGAVDILAEETTHSDYENYFGYETSYFRITDLGAFLFGMTDSYQEKQQYTLSDNKKGFTVQPNFDIVVPNAKDRMRHELFFDRFAKKSTDDKDVSVYKLDFKAMVTALNIGLTIQEISSYCDAFSSAPLPDNVKTTLSKWEAQSENIRIRTVTLIEAGDLFLLEELKNYKGMKDMLEGDISSVLIIKSGTEKKVKTLIEKHNRFCVLGK